MYVELERETIVVQSPGLVGQIINDKSYNQMRRFYLVGRREDLLSPQMAQGCQSIVTIEGYRLDNETLFLRLEGLLSATDVAAEAARSELYARSLQGDVRLFSVPAAVAGDAK
jgi:hypothetical protein